MAINGAEKIRRINYLISEVEALYHRASLKLGVSDSVSVVLYTIWETGDGCPLQDIYKKSGISKQTVNSAIRTLEEKGILYLEQCAGRAKKVLLTEQGKQYIKETAARLYEAELQAFSAWTEDEINTYISLIEKYAICLQTQIERL